jgi:hypothetical protein
MKNAAIASAAIAECRSVIARTGKGGLHDRVAMVPARFIDARTAVLATGWQCT